MTSANVADVRTPLDGLTYYWVDSFTYTPNYHITVRLYVDLPTSSGWTKPIDMALTTMEGADYMILAQNTNLMPLYVLGAPSESLGLTDSTTDTKKNTIGQTFTSKLLIVPTMDSKRILLAVTGYSISTDLSSLTLSYIASDSTEMLIADSSYDLDLEGNNLAIRWVNETESIIPQSYVLSWRLSSPLTPT